MFNFFTQSIDEEFIDIIETKSLDEIKGFFYSKKKDINLGYTSLSKSNRTFLHIACQTNDLEKVKFITENACIDINRKTDGGYTPAMVIDFKSPSACEIIKYLHKKGADLGEPTPDLRANGDFVYMPGVLVYAWDSQNFEVVSYFMKNSIVGKYY